MGQDNGVIKNNPLLSMNRFHDNKGFTSDSGSNMSDSEDFTDISVISDDNMFNNVRISYSIFVNPKVTQYIS